MISNLKVGDKILCPSSYDDSSVILHIVDKYLEGTTWYHQCEWTFKGQFRENRYTLKDLNIYNCRFLTENDKIKLL